jgi:hypothetical protein
MRGLRGVGKGVTRELVAKGRGMREMHSSHAGMELDRPADFDHVHGADGNAQKGGDRQCIELSATTPILASGTRHIRHVRRGFQGRM